MLDDYDQEGDHQKLGDDDEKNMYGNPNESDLDAYMDNLEEDEMQMD